MLTTAFNDTIYHYKDRHLMPFIYLDVNSAAIKKTRNDHRKLNLPGMYVEFTANLKKNPLHFRMSILPGSPQKFLP